MLSNAYIPYRGYYSTPFVKWQGSLANENSITLGAETSRRWLASRKIDPKIFDYLVLGVTIGQPAVFYGGPWASALIGADETPGLHISQACSTSTTGIFQAALGVEGGAFNTVYTLFTDRCSNGPHTIWPNPKGPGGQVISENWVMDHFGSDPWAGSAMIQTAENVIKLDDRAFQKRYMFPVEIRVSSKKTILVEADEGIMPTTAEGLTQLKPVLPGGQLTFGTQTHPADGHCAMVVTGRDQAREISEDDSIEIQVVSFGHARVKKAHMPMAPVPAAAMALKRAGLSITDIKVIKTHNPFAANDLYMSRQFDIDPDTFNNYGSSLIFGHPQAPTAGRSIIEGIEEAVLLGGGYVLFTGCAAGDTSAAIILKVK